MERKLIALLLLVILLVSSCTSIDPITDDLYTTNIYNSENITTDNITTDNLTVEHNTALHGQISLVNDGKVWIEFRPDIDFESVRAHSTPTWVTRSVFGGFSLPVGGANEELQFEVCDPNRWHEPAWKKLADIGNEPGAMAVYDGSLFIPCESDNTVWTYDGTSFSISGTVGNAPVYSVVYDGNLYVSCNDDDTIWVYNGSSWSKSGDVGDRPLGMAIYQGDLYVACTADDTVWVLSSGVWAKDDDVGGTPQYLAEHGANLYLSCVGGIGDDEVWARVAGTWAVDTALGSGGVPGAVDSNPQEFHIHDGNLYLTCEDDDTVWVRTATWNVATNVLTDIGNAPIGIEEYNGDLFVACMDGIWSNISDFWNENSDFVADVPMFLTEYDGKLYCSCRASDSIWVYESETIWIHIHCWLTSAQTVATDAFRLYIEFEHYAPGVDIVPSSKHDIIVETLTGIAAQYQSYIVNFPIDTTEVNNDDSLGFRITRIASSDEIAGEIVIQHVGAIFLCDKLGNIAP